MRIDACVSTPSPDTYQIRTRYTAKYEGRAVLAPLLKTLTVILGRRKQHQQCGRVGHTLPYPQVEYFQIRLCSGLPRVELNAICGNGCATASRYQPARRPSALWHWRAAFLCHIAGVLQVDAASWVHLESSITRHSAPVADATRPRSRGQVVQPDARVLQWGRSVGGRHVRLTPVQLRRSRSVVVGYSRATRCEASTRLLVRAQTCSQLE